MLCASKSKRWAFFFASAFFFTSSDLKATDARIDQPTAEAVLPYAVVSDNAYSDVSEKSLSEIGIRRLPFDWEPVLARKGYSTSNLELLRNVGFSAALYRNDKTGEVTIAFRGSDQLRDWAGADLNARMASFDVQYKAAADLAGAVKQVWPKGTPVSLAGHSLGGGLASYAGAKNPDITKVLTFNAARNPYSTSGNNSKQINVYVRDDVVGNPNGSSALARIAGSGTLPGKSFYVDSTTEKLVYDPWLKRAVPDLFTTHQMKGIVGGLSVSKKGDQVPPPTLVNSDRSSSFTGGSRAFTALTHYSSPGGISLTKAAAEGLPLVLSLDGAYFSDGRIVLTGEQNKTASIDAALFLTALRASCEGQDPYFSLDPDDISAWLAGTNEASEQLAELTKKDLAWHFGKGVKTTSPSILKFRTISAGREYSQAWALALRNHPALRSRLVFAPEWLRYTRFGEILYKADVLLKELAGGAPSLDVPRLRAAAITEYKSATERMAARKLLDRYNGSSQGENIPAGGRIWYDFTETSDVAKTRTPPSIPETPSELRRMLERKALLDTPQPELPMGFAENGGVFDLSEVYPRMYVRIRDPVTMRDGAGNFPGVDELVSQANRTPQKYADAYPEYRLLVDVFRAYLVALRATHVFPNACDNLPPLLEAEKVSSPLPEYHPTEFTMTIGWYEYGEGRFRKAITGVGALFQGGVSVGATRFIEQAVRLASDTPLIRVIKAEIAKAPENTAWETTAGRHFVSLTLDTLSAFGATSNRGSRSNASRNGDGPGRAIHQTPPVSEQEKALRLGASEEEPENEIENAPPAQRIPPPPRLPPVGNSDSTGYIVLGLLAIVFTLFLRKKRSAHLR